MGKKRLCILANFGPFPIMGGSVGGSEAVLEAITERLIKSYGWNIDIYAHNYKKASTYNGINLFPCPKGDALISTIAQNDHIFVYSCSSWSFDTLLRNIDKIDCRASVPFSLALVGAYHMQSHPESFRLLKENIKKFNLITHSKITPDYKWCIDNNLPVKVVPNGVDLSTFRENRIDFREKYKIKSKYIILSVFSFFYGKGFEVLPRIAKQLSKYVDDFVILQISSSSAQYPYDRVFFDRTKRESKGLPIRFLRDLSREDVIAAFKCSDIFLMTSKAEVAPLVILESRAAKLPFISMKVGNVMEQVGGIPIMFNSVDKKGYAIVDQNVVSHFSIAIHNLLKIERLRQAVIDEGQKNIEEIDWDNIVPLYHEVFNR